MQVIGLCRFSYPALGGFQIDHETVEERIAYLYAEERMEERFRLFETVALPSLRQQTDPEFDLIIVIGDSLPRQHRDRLHGPDRRHAAGCDPRRAAAPPPVGDAGPAECRPHRPEQALPAVPGR